MKFYRNYGWLLLLLFVLCDGGMPYVLGTLWDGFSQTKQVVSDLGSVTSPVKTYFEHGSIMTGSLLLIALPPVQYYFLNAGEIFQEKRKEINMLLFSITAFAIGDCIFTGVFSINHTTSGLTLDTIIHGLCSGAGIFGMLVAPWLMARIFAKSKPKIAQICWFIFYGALLTSAANGLAQLFAFTYKGVVQRISLAFLYLPLIILAVSIRQKRKK